MTSTELERLIREELKAAGLLGFVDERQSQFLEFPEGLFAELVLNDGSKLVEVERVAQELRERLRKHNVELDVIVRSLWSVAEVHHAGPARAVSGGIRAAEAFMATLVSGNTRATVEVDVTHSAWDEIKSRLADSLRSSRVGERNEKDIVEDVVNEFLKLQLSFGGASYWDPIRSPQQELNEAALLYLLGHSSVGQR